jgi:hypothetical protein
MDREIPTFLFLSFCCVSGTIDRIDRSRFAFDFGGGGANSLTNKKVRMGTALYFTSIFRDESRGMEMGRLERRFY